MTEDELIAEFAIEMLALHFDIDKGEPFFDYEKTAAKRRIVAMRENEKRILLENK